MDTVSISLLQIILPTTMIKLILLTWILLNKQQLLYRCQTVYECKNYIDMLVFYNFSFIIKMVLTGPGINSSRSELFSLYSIIL